MLIVTLFGMMSAATSYLIPNFLGTLVHLKPEQSGNALWWVDAIQLVAIPLTIWSIRHGDIRFSLAIGLVLVMAGCWMGSAVTHDWRADDFAWMSMALGMGNSAVLLSCIAIIVANTPREDFISLVAYIQIPRVVGPELATAVLATLVRRGEAAHSVHLTAALDAVRAQALGGAGCLDRCDPEGSLCFGFCRCLSLLFLGGRSWAVDGLLPETHPAPSPDPLTRTQA